MQAIGLKGRIEGLKTMKEPFQLDELLSKAADGGALSGSEMEFALDQLTQCPREGAIFQVLCSRDFFDGGSLFFERGE